MADQIAPKQALLPRVRSVVIKIGSSILSGPNGLDRERIAAIVGDIAVLRQRPYQVTLVSSGAVAAGTTRLGLRERPKTVPARQAAAAFELLSFQGDISVRSASK
jgi:glutamate 5-kinase